MHEPEQVIEVVGEGKSDHGPGGATAGSPEEGVIPTLVRRLCDQPDSLIFHRRPLPFLQGKKLWQKVRFAKRQAFNNRSAGLVVVVDTEGKHPGQLEELQRGRDSELEEFPTAVGVAHPCMEVWLLCDASAISRAMKPQQTLALPQEPESLPAPCKDRARNPKTVLCQCSGKKSLLSSSEMSRIAQNLRDLDLIRRQCPASFEPFAQEVVERIKPIFSDSR